MRRSPVATRRQRIIAGLQGRSIEQAVLDRQLWEDMQAEAASDDPNKLVTPDLLRIVEEARAVRAREPNLKLFFSTDDVIIVPGFMGSELTDVSGGNGLIWIDPKLVLDASQLLALGLAEYAAGAPDQDATAGVTIRPHGAIPVLYGGLKYDLEVRRYSVDIFGFDWRKNADESASDLADLIRDRAGRRFRPLHLIAHSQGTVVARRALQLLGSDLARQLVSNVVLLGPATAGTFSAAFAIAGNHSLLETARRYGIEAPPGFTPVLQSMSGLYQLLPWRTEPVDGSASDPAIEWVKLHPEYAQSAFWQTGVDATRLSAWFGWGDQVDASFLNDRTTIILGDHPTPGGVKFADGRLVEDTAFSTFGDGTVPDSLARVAGVSRIFKARDAEHMMLPATRSVIAAVRDVLAGRTPRVDRFAAAAAGIPFLSPPPEEVPVAESAPQKKVETSPSAAPPVPPVAVPPRVLERAGDVPPPQFRRLRVFSFDPLLGTELDALGTEQLTLRLPWDFADGDHLRPGPVGEYVEVVDADPANDCFYPPVDLNHPHLLAQDGLPASEGDPRFHQQMAYAVAMNTIREFETALGRTALWAPRLRRDEHGEVVRPAAPADEYVQRLRIYPHALRQANAFYQPDKKALLFGYFPAQGADVGRNLPGGTVFTCMSFDVIAHETTHALLDGLHRYLLEPSNPDVYAFHEAFADIVALFQHFSHPEVLWYQIARTHGDLRKESMLGVLAAQFGEAIGQRGALREYLGRKKRDAQGKPVKDDQGQDVWEAIEPDPIAITKVQEPHARGAILVAALFRAFVNIYELRVRDLRRIATGGTGIMPDGDLHPDLVSRLADEAAKAARHMLGMCIRALDYLPPVDVTFGEYLRALITADYDLIRDDDRRYRVAVLSAFRDWGIYPGDVRSLSVDSLLWSPPELEAVRDVKEFFAAIPLDDWALNGDRRHAYESMRACALRFHDWLVTHVADDRDRYLGLALQADRAAGSIRRGSDGHPIFEVHAFRPCRRVGPDGQERTDVVIEVVQRRKAFLEEDRQRELDEITNPKKQAKAYAAAEQDFYFRGGCTLIIDPRSGEIRYCVRKSIRNTGRLERERRFRQGDAGDKVGGIYLAGERDERNPFAFLHAGH
ncbi:MAG TPA: hypothetical protein VKD71_07495 [Gemmataceae bacterium]|nr:hypothetical protein [Gemmataceae bacterium]